MRAGMISGKKGDRNDRFFQTLFTCVRVSLIYIYLSFLSL
nr:MAG TPA: hypothetical protein [Caudoviricetes sp.]